MNTEEVALLRNYLNSALKNCHATFLPTSVKEYPTMEVEPYDEDQQIDDNFFSDEAKCNVLGDYSPSLPIAVKKLDVKHKLKYFLDGTFRTYYWGDFEIQGYIFPALLAEICVSVVKREDKMFRGEITERTIHLILPPEENKEIADLKETLLNLIKTARLYRLINIESVEKTSSKGIDIKMVMQAKVRSILHNQEVNVAGKIVRAPDEILVVDGDLRNQVFDKLDNVVGLAKSFSLKPVIVTDMRYVQLYGILNQLKVGQRTPVFEKIKEPKYKFWYLRLYAREHCDNTLQGIVKIEIRDAQKDNMNFEHFVDELTYLIFKERIPTSYPVKRWASHIYPIYVAETMAKCNLTSPLTFRQIFKVWQ